ncbi:hypothetical protein V8B55DRAFT_1516403 [Mucor lusitanicus]|uniref:Amidohydrolase-related domain-containing protein n=2 Tax=Mucor circinelloides f. lusitanicus TaxID=29924 RepID=A0A168L133_MUCCL|nr:hypothetical protein FB192DRAFT_1399742 [Mucor lusitanicus]OAD03009.1 hypothetical protein MUCCIDRAFT_109863 [Mucor lusitanicus CBS 277.49]
MGPIPKSIVDAHVHFWHPDKVNVSWVRGSAFDTHKDAVEYSEQVEKVHVEKAVYVETDVDCYHGLVEADWITHYAEQLQSTEVFGGIGGIVAFAPVHQGDHVDGYLRTLMRITNSRLKGVRYLIQDPTKDPQRVLHGDFVRGVQLLESYNLSFDLNINCNDSPEQFPPLKSLVAQCPRVQFVLDHMGKPPCDSQPGDARFEFWKEQMQDLSRLDNVYCKVSGLITEFKADDHKTQAQVAQWLKPFIQVARDSFGVDRLMFGGDWPVIELSKYDLKWQQWLEILCDIVKDWTEEDKAKLFVANATRFYKLNHTK